RHVASTRHHDIRLAAFVVARPLPDTDSGGAVLDGLVHFEPLRLRLFSSDDHIDEVAAAEAEIGDREQRVGVGWQIDPDYVGLLVHDVVDEAGVLVREPVMVLTPYM